jgi:hypothetical protein
MAATAARTKPALWEQVKREIMQGERGGRPGQWSARKAQLAVQIYKKRGGGYAGRRSADNHLRQWTGENWGTKSGAPSGRTGERYLPERARNRLSEREYAQTSEKKRHDTKRGRQFSPQPRAIARKTAGARNCGSHGDLAQLKRTQLLARAARQKIAGRSRMRKDELIRALSR